MARPIDLLPELLSFNDGRGIGPMDYVFGCAESRIVVALVDLFWPQFIVFENYVLREGFNEPHLRGWEAHGTTSRSSMESALNYISLGELFAKEPASELLDKRISFLAETLASITRIKLNLDFPDREFEVSVVAEEDDFYLTFCQRPADKGGPGPS